MSTDQVLVAVLVSLLVTVPAVLVIIAASALRAFRP